MVLSNNEELIFQAYGSLKLLFELQNKDFLHSKYYKEKFPPSNDLYKYIIDKTGIINNGTIFLLFYTLLVFPTEGDGIREKTDNDFQSLDIEINRLRPEYKSNYKKDLSSVQYIRHIRNAIAHGKVEVLNSNNGVKFFDKNKNESFYVTFTWKQISFIANRLQNILYNMYNNVKE